MKQRILFTIICTIIMLGVSLFVSYVAGEKYWIPYSLYSTALISIGFFSGHMICSNFNSK